MPDGTTKELLEIAVKVTGEAALKSLTDKLTTAVASISKSIAQLSGSNSNMEALTTKFNALNTSLEKVQGNLRSTVSLMNEFRNTKTSGVTNEVKQTETALKGVSKEADVATRAVKGLSEAQLKQRIEAGAKGRASQAALRTASASISANSTTSGAAASSAMLAAISVGSISETNSQFLSIGKSWASELIQGFKSEIPALNEEMGLISTKLAEQAASIKRAFNAAVISSVASKSPETSFSLSNLQAMAAVAQIERAKNTRKSVQTKAPPVDDAAEVATNAAAEAAAWDAAFQKKVQARIKEATVFAKLNEESQKLEDRSEKIVQQIHQKAADEADKAATRQATLTEKITKDNQASSDRDLTSRLVQAEKNFKQLESQKKTQAAQAQVSANKSFVATVNATKFAGNVARAQAPGPSAKYDGFAGLTESITENRDLAATLVRNARAVKDLSEAFKLLDQAQGASNVATKSANQLSSNASGLYEQEKKKLEAVSSQLLAAKQQQAAATNEPSRQAAVLEVTKLEQAYKLLSDSAERASRAVSMAQREMASVTAKSGSVQRLEADLQLKQLKDYSKQRLDIASNESGQLRRFAMGITTGATGIEFSKEQLKGAVKSYTENSIGKVIGEFAKFNFDAVKSIPNMIPTFGFGNGGSGGSSGGGGKSNTPAGGSGSGGNNNSNNNSKSAASSSNDEAASNKATAASEKQAAAAEKTAAASQKAQAAAEKASGGFGLLNGALNTVSMSMGMFTSSILSGALALENMATRSIGAALSGLGKIGGAVTGVVAVTAQLGLLGAVAGGAATAGILKFGADFEQSMAQVKAVLIPADRTDANMQAMVAKAQEIGVATYFSSKQAADGFQVFAQMGLNVAQMLQAIAPAAYAAEVNNVSLASSAETASVVMNAFGISADQLTHVFDVTTKGAQMGVLKFQDYNEAMAAVGVVAHITDQSLEGITAELMALTNAGEKAGQAGTDIHYALQYMTAPTKVGMEAMDALGVRVYKTMSDGSKQVRQFSDILQDFAVAQEKMSKDEFMYYLTKSVGAEGGRAIIAGLEAQQEVMVNGQKITLKGVELQRYWTQELKNSDGALLASQTIMRDTFQGQLKNLQGSLSEVAITIAGPVLLAFKSFVHDAVTPTVNALFEFENSTHLIGGSIATVWTGIFGTITTVGGSIASTIGKIFDGFTGKSLDDSQILKLKQTMGKFGEAFDPKSVTNSNDFFSQIGSNAKKLVQNITDDVNTIKAAFKGGQWVDSSSINGFTAFLGRIASYVGLFWRALEPIKTGFIEFGQIIKDGLFGQGFGEANDRAISSTSKFMKTMDVLRGIATTVSGVLRNVFVPFMQGAATAIVWLVKSSGGILDTFTTVAAGIKTIFGAAVSYITTTVIPAIVTAVGTIGSTFDKVKGAVSSIFPAAKNKTSSGFSPQTVTLQGRPQSYDNSTGPSTAVLSAFVVLARVVATAYLVFTEFAPLPFIVKAGLTVLGVVVGNIVSGIIANLMYMQTRSSSVVDSLANGFTKIKGSLQSLSSIDEVKRFTNGVTELSLRFAGLLLVAARFVPVIAPIKLAFVAAAAGVYFLGRALNDLSVGNFLKGMEQVNSGLMGLSTKKLGFTTSIDQGANPALTNIIKMATLAASAISTIVIKDWRLKLVIGAASIAVGFAAPVISGITGAIAKKVNEVIFGIKQKQIGTSVSDIESYAKNIDLPDFKNAYDDWNSKNKSPIPITSKPLPNTKLQRPLPPQVMSMGLKVQEMNTKLVDASSGFAKIEEIISKFIASNAILKNFIDTLMNAGKAVINFALNFKTIDGAAANLSTIFKTVTGSTNEWVNVLRILGAAIFGGPGPAIIALITEVVRAGGPMQFLSQNFGILSGSAIDLGTAFLSFNSISDSTGSIISNIVPLLKNLAVGGFGVLMELLKTIIPAIGAFSVGLLAGILPPIAQVIAAFSQTNGVGKALQTTIVEVGKMAWQAGNAIGSGIGNTLQLAAGLVELAAKSGIAQIVLKGIITIASMVSDAIGILADVVSKNSDNIAGGITVVGNTVNTILQGMSFAFKALAPVITFLLGVLSNFTGAIIGAMIAFKAYSIAMAAGRAMVLLVQGAVLAFNGVMGLSAGIQIGATVAMKGHTVATQTNSIAVATNSSFIRGQSIGLAASKVAHFAVAIAQGVATAATWVGNAALVAFNLTVKATVFANLLLHDALQATGITFLFAKAQMAIAAVQASITAAGFSSLAVAVGIVGSTVVAAIPGLGLFAAAYMTNFMGMADSTNHLIFVLQHLDEVFALNQAKMAKQSQDNPNNNPQAPQIKKSLDDLNAKNKFTADNFFVLGTAVYDANNKLVGLASDLDPVTNKMNKLASGAIAFTDAQKSSALATVASGQSAQSVAVAQETVSQAVARTTAEFQSYTQASTTLTDRINSNKTSAAGQATIITNLSDAYKGGSKDVEDLSTKFLEAAQAYAQSGGRSQEALANLNKYRDSLNTADSSLSAFTDGIYDAAQKEAWNNKLVQESTLSLQDWGKAAKSSAGDGKGFVDFLNSFNSATKKGNENLHGLGVTQAQLAAGINSTNKGLSLQPVSAPMLVAPVDQTGGVAKYTDGLAGLKRSADLATDAVNNLKLAGSKLSDSLSADSANLNAAETGITNLKLAFNSQNEETVTGLADYEAYTRQVAGGTPIIATANRSVDEQVASGKNFIQTLRDTNSPLLDYALNIGKNATASENAKQATAFHTLELAKNADATDIATKKAKENADQALELSKNLSKHGEATSVIVSTAEGDAAKIKGVLDGITGNINTVGGGWYDNMYQKGKSIGQGVADGINSTLGMIKAAMASISGLSVVGPSYSAGGGSGGYTGTGGTPGASSPAPSPVDSPSHGQAAERSTMLSTAKAVSAGLSETLNEATLTFNKIMEDGTPTAGFRPPPKAPKGKAPAAPKAGKGSGKGKGKGTIASPVDTGSLGDFLSGLTTTNLASAATSAEAIGKIGDAATKMSDALTKLRTFKGVSAEVLKPFMAGVKLLVDGFVDIGSKLTKDGAIIVKDFGDGSAKIADATVKFLDVFIKLKDYQAVSQTTMDSFLASLDYIITEFVLQSQKYKVEMIISAQILADAGIKIADTVIKGAEALTKIDNWRGIAEPSIDGFIYNFNQLVDSFIKNRGTTTDDMLNDAQKFVTDTGNIVDVVSKAADALSKLLDWKGVANVSIEGFVYNLKVLVANFINAIDWFTPEMLKSVAGFVTTSGQIGETTSKAADGLLKLLNWKGVATASIEGFVYNLKVLVANFVNAITWFTPEMLTNAEGFAKTVSLVGDAVGKSVDGLIKLKDFSVISGDAIILFVANLKQLVTQFQLAVGGTFKEGMYAGAEAFADVASKSVAVISGGVDGLSKLTHYHTANAANMALFVADLKSFVDQFTAAVGPSFSSGMFDAANAFAAVAGPVMTAIGTALDVFAKMVTIISPSQAGINKFITTLYTTIDYLRLKLGEAKPALFDSVKAFGDATTSVFGGIKAALDTFIALKDFKGIDPKTFDAVQTAIEYIINRISQLKIVVEGQMLTEVKAFGEAVKVVFEGLKVAIEVFNSMAGKTGVPIKPVVMLLNGILIVVALMAQAAALVAGPMAASADAFSSTITTVFTSLKTAIDTFVTLANEKDKIPAVMAALANSTGQGVGLANVAAKNAYGIFQGAINWKRGMTAAAKMFVTGAGNYFAGKVQASQMETAADNYRAVQGANGGFSTPEVPRVDVSSLLILPGSNFDENYSGWGDTKSGGSSNSNSTANDPAAAVSAMADALAKLIESLNRVNGYQPVVKAKLELFKADAQAFTAVIASLNTGSATQTTNLATFADALSKEASAVKSVMDVFTALSTFTGASKATLDGLKTNMADMLTMFTALSNQFMFNDWIETYKGKQYAHHDANTAWIKQISDFSDTLGKVGAALKAVVDALGSLSSYTAISKTKSDQVAANITELMTAMTNAMGIVKSNPAWNDDIGTFSDAVSKVATTLKVVVDSMQVLSSYTSAGTLIGKGLASNIVDMLTIIDQSMGYFQVTDLWDKNISNFSDTVGKVAGVLKSVVDTMQTLSTYVSAGTLIGKGLVGNIVEMVTIISTALAATAANSTIDKNLSDFADTIGKISTGLSGAFDLLTKMQGFRQTSTASMSAFKADIGILIVWFKGLAATVSKDLSAQIDAFGAAVNSAFSSLKSGMDVLKSLWGYRAMNINNLNNFMTDLSTAFGKVKGWASSISVNDATTIDAQTKLLAEVFNNLKTMADDLHALGSTSGFVAIGNIVDSLINVLSQAVAKMGTMTGLSAQYRDGALEFSQNILTAASSMGLAATSMENVGLAKFSAPVSGQVTYTGSAGANSNSLYYTPSKSGITTPASASYDSNSAGLTQTVSIAKVEIIIPGGNNDPDSLAKAIRKELLSITSKATTYSRVSR